MRDDDSEARAMRRLVEAAEEVRCAARALGLAPERIGELYAPLALRIDAWLWRSSRLTGRCCHE
jgi:hypothetical protein